MTYEFLFTPIHCPSTAGQDNPDYCRSAIDYFWPDGTVPTFTSWATNLPDRGDGDCVFRCVGDETLAGLRGEDVVQRTQAVHVLQHGSR